MAKKQWTDAEREEVLAMWQKGETSTVIAAKFGVTRNAALGMIARLREKMEAEAVGFKKDGRRPNPDSYELLRKRAAGTGGRPRLTDEERNRRRREKRRKHVALGKSVEQVLNGAVWRQKAIERAAAMPWELDEYETGRLPGKALMDCDGCLWPLTQTSPHMFCDAPRVAGKRYCSHHMAKRYGRGTESERTAEASALHLVKSGRAGYVTL